MFLIPKSPHEQFYRMQKHISDYCRDHCPRPYVMTPFLDGSGRGVIARQIIHIPDCEESLAVLYDMRNKRLDKDVVFP